MSARPAPSRLLPLALLVALVACDADDVGDAAGERLELAERAPRGVVLVLVDQLRADTAAEHMPATQLRADAGVRFADVRATAPWTYPSVLSLFSGLYPQQHGADGTDQGNLLTSFDPAIPLLHEYLQRAGFTTAGFVTNPFLDTWNAFHEGFDHYETQRFINFLGNRRGNQGDQVWTADMYADTVNQAVIEHWSPREPAAHEFTYVHYIDVHGPWDEAPFEPDYESAVRWIDGRIVELHDFFRERYDGGLLFVVTSDHGQDLGDDEQIGLGSHYRRRKKTMHDFNLRVPLLVLQGDPVPTGQVLTTPASGVDLLPTLLDWIGVQLPASERAQLPGHSWWPRIAAAREGADPSDAPPPERPVYARMSAFKWHTDAVMDGARKLVRRQLLDGAPVPRAERADVYDLAQDPRELTPLPGAFDDHALRALQRAAGDHGRAYRAAVETTDPALRARLEALGYLGGDEDFADADG